MKIPIYRKKKYSSGYPDKKDRPAKVTRDMFIVFFLFLKLSELKWSMTGLTGLVFTFKGHKAVTRHHVVHVTCLIPPPTQVSDKQNYNETMYLNTVCLGAYLLY